MTRIDKGEGHHKMRTKDNELVNRIKLYFEEQIDRRGRMHRAISRSLFEILNINSLIGVKNADFSFSKNIARKGRNFY